MNDQFGSGNPCEGYRPRAGRFLPLLIPLAIGFMLGKRSSMMHTNMRSREGWKNGVPPIFAEFHRRAHAAESKPEETVI